MKKILCLVFSLCVINATFSKERKPIYDFKRNMVSISADVGSFRLSKYALPNVALGWGIKMGKSNFYFLHNVQFYSNRYYTDGVPKRFTSYNNTFATDFNAMYSLYKPMKVRWFDMRIGAGLFIGYTYGGFIEEYEKDDIYRTRVKEIRIEGDDKGSFSIGLSALIKAKFLITKNVNLFTGLKSYVRVIGGDLRAGAVPIPFVGITYNF